MRTRTVVSTFALFVFALTGWFGFWAAPGWGQGSDGDDLYDRMYRDDYATTTLNFLSGGEHTQTHNFWLEGDEDWAAFNADTNRWYDLRVTDQATSCNAALYLYHESDLTTTVAGGVRDDWPAGGDDEILSWWSGSTSGTMFVKVAPSPESPGLWGNATTYTLEAINAWGNSAGLATISGTEAWIGAAAKVLRAGPQGADGIYDKPSLSVPAGALSDTILFGLDDPGDIGKGAHYDWTKSWQALHPGNTTLVQILSATPVSLDMPVTVSVQFIDGPTTFTLGAPPYTVTLSFDDVPHNYDASSMRIYRWNGSSWQLPPGPQAVLDDTVSVELDSLGPGCPAPPHDLPITGTVYLFAAAPGPPSEVSGPNWMLYE